MMKKMYKFVCMLMACLFMAACSNQPAYTQTDITMDQLEQKIADKESFVLLVERDNCPFCEAMNQYIQETKKDHPGVEVFRLDTTDFELYKQNKEDKTLVSESEDGKALLKLLPYFLYTPAIYQYENGVTNTAGIGYDQSNHTVSRWDTTSTIDFDTAEEVDVWTFLEGQYDD